MKARKTPTLKHSCHYLHHLAHVGIFLVFICWNCLVVLSSSFIFSSSSSFFIEPKECIFSQGRRTTIVNMSTSIRNDEMNDDQQKQKPTLNNICSAKKRKRSAIDDNDGNNSNDEAMLLEWVTHTSETYHYFTTEEALQIRSALLDWYRVHRRKLPWRGDEGPYDGSTAGISSKSSSANKKKKNQKSRKIEGQKSITSFFSGKKPRTGVKDSSAVQPSTKNDKGQDEKHVEPSAASESDNHEPDDSIRAYRTWVSEIMLQQTRVEAVIPYYQKWMKSFATVQDLANASDDEVNAHWAGLGFYRRAKLLHKGAKYVVDDLGGVIPQTVDELMTISGIGRYTASAISSIAFDQCVPVVDGNVCRVLSRLKGIANHIKAPAMKDNYGWILAEQIVSAGDGRHAGEVNQALMELGATYCAPSGTGIDSSDPLREFYMSTKIGKLVGNLKQRDKGAVSDLISKAIVVAKGEESCPLCDKDGVSSALLQIVEDLDNIQTVASKKKFPIIFDDEFSTIGHSNLPIPPPKKAKREEVLVVVALSYQDANTTKWLMSKRPSEGLLAGQWEFPSSCVWSNSPNKKEKSTTVEIPTINEKKKQGAIQELLRSFTLSNSNDTMEDLWLDPTTRRKSHKDAIEHVFSHVRHTMLLGLGEVHRSSTSSSPFFEKGYTTISNKEFRWMSENDMQDVGITSGVRKVLSQMKALQLKD